MNRRSLGIGLGLLVAATACRDLTGSDSGFTDVLPLPARGWLTTDRATYTATGLGGTGSYRVYGFTMVARFSNQSSEPVYLARCGATSTGPIYGVALVSPDDKWGSAFDPAWACPAHGAPLRVEPGELRTDTLHFTGPNAFDGLSGRPLGAIEGAMQLQYAVQWCPGDGMCRHPLAVGRSNLFTVRR